MLHRHILASSVLIAAAVLAGCSSSIDPTAQKVSVNSSPDDATVTINGKVMDRTTDTSFVLNRDQDYVIVVSKTGYKPVTTRVGHIATGAEAPGAPRFELTESNISVTLEEDAFAQADANIDPKSAVATPASEKIDTLASEKIARDRAAAKAAREVAEAKAAEEARAKAAREVADLKASEEAKAVAEEAKLVAEAKTAAEAKAKAEQDAATASAAATEEAIAKANSAAGEKIAAAEAKLAASEAKLAAANEKIAILETQLEQAKDFADRPAKTVAAPASVTKAAPAATAKGRSSAGILAQYKELREELNSGEITKAEYDKAVANITR